MVATKLNRKGLIFKNEQILFISIILLIERGFNAVINLFTRKIIDYKYRFGEGGLQNASHQNRTKHR